MHILQAAHCVAAVNARHIIVHAGSISERKGGQTRHVSKITTHPGYSASSSSRRNDIAILHLSARLDTVDPAVGFIRLPSADSSTLSAADWPASEANVSELNHL